MGNKNKGIGIGFILIILVIGGFLVAHIGWVGLIIALIVRGALIDYRS